MENLKISDECHLILGKKNPSKIKIELTPAIQNNASKFSHMLDPIDVIIKLFETDEGSLEEIND